MPLNTPTEKAHFVPAELVASARANNVPNCARLLDYFTDQHYVYYVFMAEAEFKLNWSTAKRLLTEKGDSIPLYKTKRMFHCLVQTAACLLRHQMVLHTDLTPSNVLVSADLSSIRLIDFGSVRLLDRYGHPNKQFRFVGNELCAPPESLQRLVSPSATLVWQLGLFLYQILTGKTATSTSASPSQLRGVTSNCSSTCGSLVSITGAFRRRPERTTTSSCKTTEIYSRQTTELQNLVPISKGGGWRTYTRTSLCFF